VYNLQTAAEWYNANGIITHNCTAIPEVEGVPALSWQYGPQWFAAQSVERQRAMMGAGRYELWSEGKFDFSDLVTPTWDDTWGRGLAVTPVTRLASMGQAQLPMAAAGAS